ncbi:MAG: hypothetical protein ACXVJX_18555 [Acidimicrobiia bacterium]
MLGTRLVGAALVLATALGATVTIGITAAGAAGGAGATQCSAAGNPAVDPNPGAMIREHLPFGGNGNDGSNPGFNFNGFSGCKP